MKKPRYSMTKPNITSILLLIQPYRGYQKENSNTRRVTTPKKTQEIKHFRINPKEENHIHIIPPPVTKITRTNNHLSLIFLNINGLNLPIKRHKITDWITMEKQEFCCIQETHFNNKDSYYLRIKHWKKIFQANVPKKQAGIAILIYNKIDFQPKL